MGNKLDLVLVSCLSVGFSLGLVAVAKDSLDYHLVDQPRLRMKYLDQQMETAKELISTRRAFYSLNNYLDSLLRSKLE